MAVTSDLGQLSLRSISHNSSGNQPWWPTTGFEVAISREQDFVVVRLRGHLNAGTSPTLALVLSSLLGEGCSSVVLDLAELELLDSGGAWLLDEAPRLFNQHDAELVVRSPRRSVQQVLDSARLSPLVESDRTAVDNTPLPS